MARLDEILVEIGVEALPHELTDRFLTYLSLLQKWNAKLNLTSIRSEEEILRRHFAECIFVAQQLPKEAVTVLDFGSGAGFPGIPIALCRPEMRVTLAESQAKKCGFLRECVRTLGLSATVHCGRAEDLAGFFDVVAMRAVDKMEQAAAFGAARVVSGGWLALMTTESAADRFSTPEFTFFPPLPFPGSERGVLLVGARS